MSKKFYHGDFFQMDLLFCCDSTMFWAKDTSHLLFQTFGLEIRDTSIVREDERAHAFYTRW